MKRLLALDTLAATLAAHPYRNESWLHGRRPGPQEVDPLIGRVLNGQYEVVSLLANDATCRRYRAISREGTLVQIQVLYEEFASDLRHRQRFVSAAELSSRVSHPHVICVLALGSLSTATPYLVSELPRGRPLSELLEADGPVPVERAAPIFLAVARGLDAIHAQGVAHRDLSASRIFIHQIDGVPSPVIANSRRAASRQAQDTQKPRSSASTTSLDLFSLGCIFYRMLTGVHPYQHWSRRPWQRRAASTWLDIGTPMIPIESKLGEVVACLLLPSARRYSDTRAVIDALEPLCATC